MAHGQLGLRPIMIDREIISTKCSQISIIVPREALMFLLVNQQRHHNAFQLLLLVLPSAILESIKLQFQLQLSWIALLNSNTQGQSLILMTLRAIFRLLTVLSHRMS
jgi:hypothetical protein